MKKSFIAIAMVALTCGFFALKSSNAIVCSNIEALSSGEQPDREYYTAYKGTNNTSYPKDRMRGSNENPSFCTIVPSLGIQDGTCWEIIIRP